METDSDEETEDFTGMELPPLITQLKKILSEYPDGGQIIKELIQNAEDAGATEIKLMFDGRSINQSTGRDKAHRKFFKGPALCVFNNAVFRDSDWKGIRMIYNSVKEDDPLRVGRFGLGFKSVYHLTDYPCILSADKLLLVDPQHPNSTRVNAMMELKKLANYKKRMDIDAFFEALDGTFGVTKEILTTGRYDGTLFWFPLRNSDSKISSNLYNEKKVMALFQAIQSESKHLLLFLKNLTYMSLCKRTDQGHIEDIAISEVKNAQHVSHARDEFKRKIEKLSAPSAGPSESCRLQMVIEITSCHKKQKQVSSNTWLVVNYFTGKNTSKDFLKLMQDPDLAYSPYVSVAAPFPVESKSDKIDGHVFCFLPLPREDTSLTGLPVHVNGFFALNQSRHHVKWQTEDQNRQNITDKAVLWNKCLIEEALPRAYQTWMQNAVEITIKMQNQSKYVSAVHQAIPTDENIRGKWCHILKPSIHLMMKIPFLFSQIQNKWVTVKEALFDDPEIRMSKQYRSSVIKTLTELGKSYVDIPSCLVRTLSQYIDVNQDWLTPSVFSKYLKNDQKKCYTFFTNKEKTALLRYLFLQDACINVEGLELLPLASGQWATFTKASQKKIFKCNPEQLRLFQGLEDMILTPKFHLPEDEHVVRNLNTICDNGYYQLKVPDVRDTEMLLQKVVETFIPGDNEKHLYDSDCLNVLWLQNDVWQYIIKSKMVHICEKVPLFPILKNGNWVNPKLDLIRLSKLMTLRKNQNIELPFEVTKCLEALSVTSVPSLPPWINITEIQQYIHLPKKESVVSLIGTLQLNTTDEQRRDLIDQFNHIEESYRIDFMKYIRSVEIDEYDDSIALLKSLKIFPGRKSANGKLTMFSVNEGKKFTTCEHFPIEYPDPLLDGYGETRHILLKLGVSMSELSDMILSTLYDIQAEKRSEAEIIRFMKFFRRRFKELRENIETRKFADIVHVAKNVAFLKSGSLLKKASDLFDGSDKILQNLFVGENMCLELSCDEEALKVLRILGLKTREDITVDNLLKTAKQLDLMSKSKPTKQIMHKKANALMTVLESDPDYLEQQCEGTNLKSLLLNLEFIDVKLHRTETFPVWLPWKITIPNRLFKPADVRNSSLALLVGSVMPIAESSSPHVSEIFSLGSTIPTQMLIQQLNIVKTSYKENYKYDLLFYLKTLYEWLQKQWDDIDSWKKEEIIWNGEQFCLPENVVIERAQDDLKLAPYFSYIDASFDEFSELFKYIGCETKQSTNVLLNALSKIACKEIILKSDLKLSIKIIVILSQNIDTIEPNKKEDILIPIHTDDGTVFFKPLADCTYTNNPEEYSTDNEDSDNDESECTQQAIYFVHKKISENVANLLGIKSLQRRHLINTEDFVLEESGQEEELTTRLRTLIEEGYRDGLSIVKELLQNADDAGAQHIKFLYDERENRDAMNSLLDNGMRLCQGPALWAYNSAKFSDDDFRNIRKLNGATKKENVNTIGKFGLGFCSVYNLTDVPSFVSGNKIVILDPHKTHLPGSSAGLKIDLSVQGNRKLIKRHQDQFKPYDNIFGCNIFSKTPEFDGTLFRLPLRTNDGAIKSEIRKSPYSKHEVSTLLEMFIANAGNLLLFTQNIKSVEVYHLPASAATIKEQSLIFNIEKECIKLQNGKTVKQSCKNTMSRYSCQPDDFWEVQNISVKLNICKAVKNIRPSLKQSALQTTSSWVVSWAAGTRESKFLAANTDMAKAVPLAAVAVPYDPSSDSPKLLAKMGKGFFKEGRLYCFLPIPGETKLPWHLHGCFDVTSDRRQLTMYTEQDKTSQRTYWNEYLLSDAVLNAFQEIILYFARNHRQIESSNYYNLWPIDTTETVKTFVQSFCRHIVKEDVKIFHGNTRWLSFNEIIVLDPTIRSDVTVGNVVYEMLKVFTSRPMAFIIDLPITVLDMLKRYITEDISRKIIGKEEIIKVFLDNITDSYWRHHCKELNIMVLFTLSSDDSDIEHAVKNTKCIPCDGTEQLKAPNELIHPTAKISRMFDSEDGKFPAYQFRKEHVLKKLVKLGMIDNFLPFSLIIDRCKSVETLAKKCCTCARTRIQHIFTYLDKPSLLKNYTNDNFESLRDIHWLPVLTKPLWWTFTWYCDICSHLKKYENGCRLHRTENVHLCLAKPRELHRSEDQDLIGGVANVVDESIAISGSRYVWQLLGILPVRDHKHTEKVVEQLCVLSEEYNSEPKIKYNQFREIYTKIITNLNDGMKSCDPEWRKVRSNCISKLCSKQVLLMKKGKLVFPYQVSFKVQEDCYPFLCRLPDNEKIFQEIYFAINVKQTFSVQDIIRALNEKRKTLKQTSKEDIHTFVKILQNLVSAMEEEDKPYEYYKEFKDDIMCPDKSGNLYPTHELVMEDELFQPNIDLKVMHEDVPASLGEKLGIKSKKSKCLEKISFAIPWGQKENLVTRLEGLLKDYPCDASIMKELLQNSDDANAEELHFVKDYRSHPTDRIFGEKHLQGPALCVYNDSFFTENDMQGIQNLGLGSKREDPSKTGQYGVGFNAVYHLTDTPSFLTKGPGLGNGVLCILDPLCKNIPVEETSPGLKCAADVTRDNFPDMLSGYLENYCFFKSGKGTMFRFPLRTKPNILSSKTMKSEDIDKMLDGFIKEMSNALLFVKRVKTIKISNITTGQLKLEYSIQVNISEEDTKKRQDFFKKVKEIANVNKNHLEANLYCEALTVDYILQLEDNDGCKAKWLIVQRFGGSNKNDIETRVQEAFQDKQLCQLPIGGVALPCPDFEKVTEEIAESASEQSSIKKPDPSYSVFRALDPLKLVFKYASSKLTSRNMAQEMSPQRNTGQLFTFLPLPICTGFTVHINGHFSLDHSRREVWKEGYRHDWNVFLGSCVIIPSWISAIKYFRRYFSPQNLNERNIYSRKLLNKMLTVYHSLFPIENDAKHGYSNTLLKQFYNYISHDETEIFPVLQTENKVSFSVVWVPLKKRNTSFEAVFNNILLHMNRLPFSENNQHKSNELEQILKNVGMKLIDSPLTIQSTLEQLGHGPIDTASPSFVLRFLKTFSDKEPGTCVIGEMGEVIENTRIGSIAELIFLLEYITGTTDFSTNAEGLPVLLTSDNKLHTLHKYSAVFHSFYGNLFPSSKSVFVHDQILVLLSHKDLVLEGYLKSLNVTEFKMLLEREKLTNFKSKGSINWNKEETETLITPKWIRRFYNFIAENSEQIFYYSVGHFRDYNFLPAIYDDGKEKQTCLVQLSMSYCLYVDRRFQQEMSTVMKKLKLPYLDRDVLSNEQSTSVNMVLSLLADTSKPVDLLKCLHHHKQKISSCITISEACSLLAYFNNHVLDLQTSDSRRLLQQLPLYCSHQNTLVSLDTCADILILPGSIPASGIKEWALQTNIILLKQTEQFTKLYEYLDLPNADILPFYAERLVPNIHLLPTQHWLKHIGFIKDLSLINSNDKLLNLLKALPFLPVGGELKRASELHWHANEVFSLMLTDADFPPRELRTSSWKSFFRKLDMKFEVTDQMMLQFAVDIESLGRQSITSHVRQKSEALLSCFMLGKWSAQTLRDIKKNRFIVPFKVDKDLSNIFIQSNEASKLIAFENSASMEFEYLCWSSVDLLSTLPKDYTSQLGIYLSPPIDRVILHCQNVCTELEKRLECGTVEGSFVQMLMGKLYSYFNDQAESKLLKRLESFPVVYLPLHAKLVQTRAIVLGLDLKREIKPYLYTAPVFYGQFFELFRKMGSKESLDIGHCMYVLRNLKNKVQDDRMYPEELDVAKRAIVNILHALKEHQGTAVENGVLFLPNKEMILKASSLLTVSDNWYFERKLRNQVSVDYFIGFASLEIKQTDPCAIFTKLPESIRPKLLSNVVKRHVSLDELEVVQNSVRAMELEELLQSAEFIAGVSRLVKHHMTRKNKIFDEENIVPQITENLKNTKIVSVFDLKTSFIYEDRLIDNLEEPLHYYLINCTLYINEPREGTRESLDARWMSQYARGILELVKKCSQCNDIGEDLSILLHKTGHQVSDISYELDILGIDAFNLSQSFRIDAFPKPGSYVEVCLHPFLEQAIRPFRREEYRFTAMELEDSCINNETDTDIEPVYIYVRIIQEVTGEEVSSLLRKVYLVDTGTVQGQFEKIPIYRLYRFVRRSKDTSSSIVGYDCEPINAIPFDDTCKRIRDMLQEAWTLDERERIRIIKRLRMRWHPDRNTGNQEYANRVFNYISNVILLLERGEQVSSIINERTGMNAPDMSQSAYHHMVLNVDRRTRIYSREYHDNVEDYNRTFNCGRYSHALRDRTPRPDINEASRWIKQAKHDCRAAHLFHKAAGDVQGYNWICYTCHQACEKALRAAHYSTNVNDMPGRTHSLTYLSRGFGQELTNHVREMQNRFGDYNRMRYPNSVSRPDIPSDLFSKDDAQFALEKTNDIINTVVDEYDIP